MMSCARTSDGCHAGRVTEGAAAQNDEIRLTLPADPRYGRVARVAATGIGMRLGMEWPDIQDLGLALDETVILLLRPEGSSGEMTFTFTIEPDQLVIDALSTAGTDQFWTDDAAIERFEEILDDVIDVHTLDATGRHVTLVKLFD
jgi:hypothetical protein